jgi:hypothetical protein
MAQKPLFSAVCGFWANLILHPDHQNIRKNGQNSSVSKKDISIDAVVEVS